MKKLLFLLLALPLVVVSCSDDGDNLPKVSLSVDGSGGVVSDGVIYLLQGDTLSVDSITVVAENSTPGVRIASANYFLDYRPVWSTVVAPFAFKLDSGKMSVGRHLFEIQCPIAAVGYAPAVAFMSYQVRVVDDVADMPVEGDSTAVTGGYTFRIEER